MPVSANTSLNYTRDELLTMAIRLTGILTAGQAAQASDIAMAAQFMNLELMHAQAEGVILTSVERTTLALVAGTASYALPASTLDVEVSQNDIAGTIVPSAGSESVVGVMSRDEYLVISDKTATVTGRPTRVYIERSNPLTLIFWPVPDASSPTFRYARTKLLADMDAGNVNADLRRQWLMAITYAVASHLALAKSLGLDRAGYLRSETERMKKRLRDSDGERGKIRFHVSRGRRW